MTDDQPTPGPLSRAPGGTSPAEATSPAEVTSLAEAEPHAATRAAPEEHELLCTLCGLRACWTG